MTENYPDDRTETKTIVEVRYVSTTVNGNCVHMLRFSDGATALTQADASVNYGIDNPEHLNRPVEIQFTRYGRVRFIREVKNNVG